MSKSEMLIKIVKDYTAGAAETEIKAKSISDYFFRSMSYI